jgi:hypothetical protein
LINLLCSLVQCVGSHAVSRWGSLLSGKAGLYMKLTTVDLPRIGMRGAEPLFPHIPLWLGFLIKHRDGFCLSGKVFINLTEVLTFICLRATTLSYDVAHRKVRS